MIFPRHRRRNPLAGLLSVLPPRHGWMIRVDTRATLSAAERRKNAAHDASRGIVAGIRVSHGAPKATVRQRLLSERGAQIVEFAVSLPLLVVFVVGIFDFSNAFTLKQKLTNISRDAARLAAADPATDILKPTSTVPASVDDAYQAIQRYFTVNNLSNCGITEAPSGTPGPPMWTFSATSAPCSLKIVINRGYYLPAATATQTTPSTCVPTGGSGLQVVATCVSIQYAYQWYFGKVANLLGPGTTLPPNITATSIVMNEN